MSWIRDSRPTPGFLSILGLGMVLGSLVFVARTAMTAEARMKMLPISSARWKPAVNACATGAWAASRSCVRLVATAEKIASPSAPPSCCEAFRSAAASPALSAGTPAFAAVVTPTNTAPRPIDVIIMPGSRSPT